MKRLLPLPIALLLLGCPEHSPTELQPPDASVPDADAGPPAAAWAPVLENLDGALLSIWGSSKTDVWTVGGALGNGFPSLAIRFDGTTWKTQNVGGTETYWWVHGSSATDVWLVGEKGRVTHWDGTKFEERSASTTATLFGVLALAPNDVWSVGGLPETPDGPNDLVLHWDGSAWKPETLPTPTKSALFKVWGTADDDLYVVGENGVIWHRTSGGWAREGEGLATGRLTTVYGCAGKIWVVGGRDLLVKENGAWAKSAIDPLLVVNDLNGVSCHANATKFGEAVVVGGGSLKLRRVNDAWQTDFGSKPFTDLHGSWTDETGAFWGVGGNFNATPKDGASRLGVVARYADDSVPSTFQK